MSTSARPNENLLAHPDLQFNSDVFRSFTDNKQMLMPTT